MMAAIEYQGRKARRAGSEQRRRTILEASLRIIVGEGIRAVRHRAVAREADVPLSATTYYFKDISELIADTFTLFAERAMAEVIVPFREKAFALMQQYSRDSLADPAQRQQLIEALSQMIADYVIEEAEQRRDHLIAEQAFMQEAIMDSRLRTLADLYLQQQLDALEGACAHLGSNKPVLDAELMYTTITSMEQRLLVHPERAKKALVYERMVNLLDKITAHG